MCSYPSKPRLTEQLFVTSHFPEMKPTAPPAEEKSNQTLYPVLPTGETSQAHRLHELSIIKKHLECEIDTRRRLYDKYRKAQNVIEGIDSVMVVASIGTAISGVALLSTVIAAPVVLGLEIGAVSCGAVRIVSKYLSRRLETKAKKHNEIRTLGESKLNSIAETVSKALIDNFISDAEFKQILQEYEKYGDMKRNIQYAAKKARAAVKIDEDAKKMLIEKGREQARSSFIKKLSA